jgi:hypothetical protein
MKTLMIVGWAVLTMLLGTASFFPVAAGDLKVVPQNPEESGFDREDCEEQCRRRFGVSPYFLHHRDLGRLRYRLYARCIQDCNRRFWRNFDRDTEVD